MRNLPLEGALFSAQGRAVNLKTSSCENQQNDSPKRQAPGEAQKRCPAEYANH